MEYTKEENFVYARKFLMEGDIDNYGGHYYMLLKKEPDNAEAEFFSAYMAYQNAMNSEEIPQLAYSKKSSVIIGSFDAMAENSGKAVAWIKDSESDEDEKLFVVSTMVKIFAPIPGFLAKMSSAAIEPGALGLYALGDAIEKEFGAVSGAMDLAAEAWKNAIELQHSCWAKNYNGIKLEDYAEKVKKVDPTYIAPKTPIMKKIMEKLKGLGNKSN